MRAIMIGFVPLHHSNDVPATLQTCEMTGISTDDSLESDEGCAPLIGDATP